MSVSSTFFKSSRLMKVIIAPPKSADIRSLDKGTDKDNAEDPVLEQERAYLDEEDGHWYIGKAKEEFRKRKDSQAALREDEDPVQVPLLSILCISSVNHVLAVGTRTQKRGARPRNRVWV